MQQHIRETAAQQRNLWGLYIPCYHCPVANALKAILKVGYSVKVNNYKAVVITPLGAYRQITFPKNLREAIRNYDLYHDMQPGEYEIEDLPPEWLKEGNIDAK